MAANLTLSAAAVDSTGKVLTATISGGTGTGYAITSATGLNAHTGNIAAVGGLQWSLQIASVSVLGTTLTVNLTTPFGSGETVLFDIATGSNLTDSGANTATGQTNLAVTNNSAASVTSYSLSTSLSSFEINMLSTAYPFRSTDLTQNTQDVSVEFVADCTEAAFYTFSGTTTKVAVDSATSLTTVTNNAATWVAKALTTTPLTSDKHLFRVSSGDYAYGVRVSGGARTLHTVNTTKRAMVPTTSAVLTGGGATTTPVTTTGVYKASNTAIGSLNIGSYLGTEVDVAFDGSGVEIACTATGPSGSAWSASIDGAAAGALIPTGDASTNGLNTLVAVASGLTPGAHTLAATFVSVTTGSFLNGVRAINGTKTTASTAVSDTTMTVASVSTLAVGHWLRIDYYSKREWRQITGIAGTTITLNAALSQAHASGCAVTSYSAPAANLTTWVHRDLTAKRLAAMGDSNTAGANDYGNDTVADSTGTFYNLYDPRLSPMFLAADPLGIEVMNLGVQGQTSAQMAARAATDFSTYGRGPFDYITVWAGTNDINSTSTTPTAYQANLETIVTAAIAQLKTGGKVIVIPTATPSGVTNAGGLNNATVTTACQAVVANHAASCIDGTGVLAGLVAGDLRGVHYHPSGQTKIATNLSPYLGGVIAYLLGSGFFAA